MVAELGRSARRVIRDAVPASSRRRPLAATWRLYVLAASLSQCEPGQLPSGLTRLQFTKDLIEGLPSSSEEGAVLTSF